MGKYALTLFEIGALHAPKPTKKEGDIFDFWGLGNVKVIKIFDFPLCLYEVEILSGKLKGCKTKASFEYVE